MIDFTGAVWRKAERSQGSGDACVEVAGLDTVVAVRDSKNPAGPALAFTRSTWAVFAEQARTGRFDR
jgi:Domain of unknown function (DUF397)